MGIEERINDMPENMPLIKDSGLWMLMDEGMREVVMQQGVNESFGGFIERCISDFGVGGL
ncbi:MAG: hypothetical protein KAT62_03560 [Desulfuromonadales bacterium]|nr:hypothetical protein [Desulfuromonadales bacterium]